MSVIQGISMRLWLNKISLRNGLLASLSVILIGVILTGCTGTVSQPKGWSGGTVSNGIIYIGSMTGQLEAIDLATHTKTWGKPLEPSHPPAIYGTPSVGPSYAYVGGYNGKIYAYVNATGDFHNTFDTGSTQAIVGGTLVSNGNVYFGSSDGKLYAINADTMQKVWQFPYNGSVGKIWSTPVTDGSTIYVTSLDKKLYAIDANTGNKKWELATDGAIVGSPVIYNNTIYFGSIDRHVYAVNPDGTLKWKSTVPTKGWFWTSVVINNNVVYAPCLDGKVYLLDAGTGASVADAVSLDSQISSQPVVAGNAVIVASQAGHVYAIDTTSYQKRELNNLSQTINAPLAAGNGSIFVHTSDDTLSALDAGSGIVQWKLSLK